MEKQDYLSVLITFGFGFVAGFYLYLVGFSPAFGEGRWLPDLNLREVIVDDSFRVVGDAYGGCQRARSCPAFEIRDDRSYRYLAQPDGEVRTGVVPAPLLSSLEEALENAPLERYAEESEATGCSSYVDGLDYRYTIEQGDDAYILDTCKTVFSEDSRLAEALTSAWQYFENY